MRKIELTIKESHLVATFNEDAQIIKVSNIAKGEYAEQIDNPVTISTDDDLARLLFNILAPVAEVERFPSYRAWVEYLQFSDDAGNPQDYERYCDQAEQWFLACGVFADDVLNYLADKYNI